MDIALSLDRPRVPNTSLKLLHRIGRTLLRDRPEPATPVVELSAAKLEALLAVVHTALISRFREVNPRILASEADFDRAVDANWIWVRKQLEGYRDAYAHAGLDALPQSIKDEIDLPKLRRRAELAGDLHERLFGAEGTNWVMSSWMAQAESMSMILGLIDSDGLAATMDEVLGPEVLPILRGLQAHYEEVVAVRMSRDQSRSDDFQELRTKLRWQIEHYRTSVETLRDVDDPASFEVVERALRCLKLVSKRLQGNTSAAVLEDELDEGLIEGLEDGLVEVEVEPSEALAGG